MPGILDIAVTGLNAATTRVANATSSIVNASSTSNSGKNIVNAGDNRLDKNLVELKVDQVNYGANALVIKTAEKMQKALLDIKT